MLRWPFAGMSVFCALAVYGQSDVNQSAQHAIPSINVSPLRVELDSGEQSEQFRVSNDSDSPLNVQIRIFSWSQSAFADQYAPTGNILISPSITRIAPRRTQVFRLIRGSNVAIPGEARYRIIVDQLPDRSAAVPKQSQTRLRFSVPLFVGRDEAGPANIQWKIAGKQLLISNSGGQTAKIAGAVLTTAKGEQIAVRAKGSGYILGQSQISWDLDRVMACENGEVKITALVDRKQIDAVPTTACP